jgi:hypothetical protein
MKYPVGHPTTHAFLNTSYHLGTIEIERKEEFSFTPVIVFDKDRKMDISGSKWKNVDSRGRKWEFCNGLTFEGSRSIVSTPKGA